MTDIVEELRERQVWSGSYFSELFQKAADEIGRLRHENDVLRLGWCKEAEKRQADWANESGVT